MSRYRVIEENGIYFTTHTIVEWIPVFMNKKYFQIIIESLKYCQKKKGLYIFGYVIMPNHFHLIAQTKDNTKFQDVMRDMKIFTSKAIIKELEDDGQKLLLHVIKKAAKNENRKHNHTIWQDKYHPQVIYTDTVWQQKLEYVHNNPVRKGFVQKPECWLYSSARNYIIENDSILKIERLEML